MAQAMTLIASTTLIASGNPTFSSIPSTYRDLRLVVTGTGSGSNFFNFFNADSTLTNYSYTYVKSDGTTTSSAGAINTAPIIGTIDTGVSVYTVDILDYSATDKHKMFIARTGGAGLASILGIVRWANTAAITTVAPVAYSNAWGAGTTFYLYGISA